MKIGTDISLEVCRTEGYMVMSFDGRKPITATRLYRFQRSTGLDVNRCLEELLCRYVSRKAQIDSFIGESFPTDPKEYTDLRMILYLADALDMYCSLYY